MFYLHWETEGFQPGVASDNFKRKTYERKYERTSLNCILTWWSCKSLRSFSSLFFSATLLLILQHFHHKIQEVLRYSDAELNVTSLVTKKACFSTLKIYSVLRPFSLIWIYGQFQLQRLEFLLFQDFERWMFRLWSKIRLGYEMRWFSGPSRRIWRICWWPIKTSWTIWWRPISNPTPWPQTIYWSS